MSLASIDKPDAGSDAEVGAGSAFVASPYWLAAGILTLMFAAFALAGWAPLGFSIITVFLFAGPHNWFEARYFLTRMPARWGRLATYFTVGLGGVVLLTVAFASIAPVATWAGWDGEGWNIALAGWNSALVLWIMALVAMRSRQNPKRDWNWVYPVGFALMALNWLAPRAWDLALVYIHPLVALWILDREIAERKPQWQTAYRACLLLVPMLVGLLWWRLGAQPNLPGGDALSERITDHAGGSILYGVSTHFLVATHTFLEMLHYSVWLIAIPLVTWREEPWNLDQVPLARGGSPWRWLVIGSLVMGGLFVFGFWGGFLADYPGTRDFYFTVAMLHVLAEVPFLLRLL